MSVTYTIERGDPVSRVRRDIGDKSESSAKFSDEDILSVLAETQTTDFLALQFASSTAGLVGATVEVTDGAQAVELVLRRIAWTGTALSGGASTVTLPADASAVDDAYNGQLVGITDGTGEGGELLVADYVGSSRTATLAKPWPIAPDSTSVVRVFRQDRFSLAADGDYDKVVDLFLAIQALGNGWSVSLAARREGDPIEGVGYAWAGYMSDPRFAALMGRRTADLAYTPGELDAWGVLRRLSIYEPTAAVARLRELVAADISEPIRKTEGDVTVERRKLQDVRAGALPVAVGVFSRIA